jgi:predicted  nucleic acid-binding Zn-ribbon protein
LQEIDRVRRERLDRIEALEREIAEIESDLERRRASAAAVAAEAEALDVRRRDLEKVFEAEGAKMKERRMRLNRVRNEKELQALRHEIEIGKEANQQLEEQVIDALETLDTLNESREQATAEVAELEGQARERIDNNRAQLEAMRLELETDRAAREDLRSRLEPNLLKRYELLFDRRGGMAVVDVAGGTCQGCHRMIPPQLFIELQRHRDGIHLCPACHRILLWQPKPEAPGN